MHQHFNIEYSAGFMNIHEIIPEKCLLIRFKTFYLTHRHYCSLNIVVHVISFQFIVLPHGYFNARFNQYERSVVQYRRHGYHSASPVTWLQKTELGLHRDSNCGPNNLAVD